MIHRAWIALIHRAWITLAAAQNDPYQGFWPHPYIYIQQMYMALCIYIYDIYGSWMGLDLVVICTVFSTIKLGQNMVLLVEADLCICATARATCLANSLYQRVDSSYSLFVPLSLSSSIFSFYSKMVGS